MVGNIPANVEMYGNGTVDQNRSVAKIVVENNEYYSTGANYRKA